MNQLVPQQNPNSNPKSRKPYTISKQRENWTEDEHQKFLEALTLFDRDWKKIEGFVGTKTVIQIRSHAQKYFIKVAKNNTGERIPPPRPKRKSIQPYPQKQKHEMGMVMPDISGNPFISSTSFANWMSYRGLMPNSDQSNDLQRQLEQLQQAQQYIQQAVSAAQNPNRGMNVLNTPNFPKIYSFLSNLFEPSSTSYNDTLNEMSQIDRETMQLLMHNLAINLANQQYKDQHITLYEQCRMMKRDEESIDDLNSSSGMVSPRANDFNDNMGGSGNHFDYSNNNNTNNSMNSNNMNMNMNINMNMNMNSNNMNNNNNNNNQYLFNSLQNNNGGNFQQQQQQQQMSQHSNMSHLNSLNNLHMANMNNIPLNVNSQNKYF
ncbi:hypothetical protein CYY_003797 [Polysphondylium violaceum]|uniref:Myb domain-containing protein n=1 Tax=Polysphondylium violaceum TaxID=133409 RepID=A0A8J4V0U9_9MYCE|nr:hypothetical protein CYY_003797 [Polysphondylium violaceum]